MKAERSQTAGQDESQPGTCSWAAEGPEGLASPTQGCRAIPKASFQVGLCHLTLQPPSRQVPPRGKPSPANRAMALLRSLRLLTIQDICVYSMTHNGGLFSLERLHHCLSPGAYHVSLLFFFFFFTPRSACCYFQHLSHVPEGIHALRHMARTAEIFPVVPRRGFSSKKHNRAMGSLKHMYSTQGRYSTQKKLGCDSMQSENPTESQKA